VRVRLRYVLLVAQMLLAMGLYVWSDASLREVRRHSAMVGTTPGFTLLIALNAPLAFLRELYFRHTAIREPYDRLVFLFGIGVLWHWVGRNIESWNKRRTVVLFTWLPLRAAADLTLIGVGGFWAFVVINWRLWANRVLPNSTWIWILSVFTPIALWAVALVFFFGRDLLQIIRGRPSQQTNAPSS
jgi:hypothetical protein